MTAAVRRGSRLPPAVWDALLPALLLLNVITTRAPHELPVATALTAALALPLLWRRRAPFTVFGAVAAAAFVQWLMDVQLPADIALLVALCTVAANTGRRGTLVAGAVVEAGVLLACLRWTTEGAFLTPFVAATAMTVAAAVLGVNVRTTRAYLAALEERAARLQQEQEQQARLAVAKERARITREMHDIVTHNLSVMVALTDAAVYAQHRLPDKATAAMLQISETGRQALTDMRRSLGVLRTDEPDAQRHPLPGIAQLEALADQMCAAGLPTRLDVHGGHAHIPATAQLTVYRLVQEALTNSLKHTPTGTRASVRI
ncbi:sensor histidine kinase [Kitasatospora sp. NPDC057542]|uniref:sensor histidine kinase n=1 Tax=Kitasatospora sp. NPDC057542 TaxID=3346162 RepID=UPI0036CF30C1